MARERAGRVIACCESSTVGGYTESAGSTEEPVYERDMTLKHLTVNYDGFWIPCKFEGMTWTGAKKFNIHNVDPNQIELARIFQLVIKEQSKYTDKKPTRAWYTAVNVPMPQCIKPLHTAQHLREMFKNMEEAGHDWGSVYFQQWDCLYSLPSPLSDVPTFEGIENLHEHAALIQDIMDVLSPFQLRLLHKNRRIPFAEPADR